jgi:hypothetical protein
MDEKEVNVIEKRQNLVKVRDSSRNRESLGYGWSVEHLVKYSTRGWGWGRGRLEEK